MLPSNKVENRSVMNITKIPKKTKGQFREIAVPTFEEKLKLWPHLNKINEKQKKLCSAVVHGFVNGRSPVTNAKLHVGYKYSLSFDLSDFFDTVKPEHLSGKLSKEEINECMPDGRAYQGLPTSPGIANLAALDMDRAIIKFLKEKKVVYSRYADDMTFSFNDFSLVDILKKKIKEIVSRCGFRLNEKKTRLQDSRFGRRGITGISVGEDISVSRKIKRKIRAARHQNNENSLKGLEEWAKLKTPKEKKISYTQSQIDALTKEWGIKKVEIFNAPEKEEIICGDLIITGDLPYILGPSDWATNWTSCLCHARDGLNHKKVNFWAHLRGTRIAGLQNGEEKTIQGITRKKLRARVYVHTLRDLGLFYDQGQIYGESYEAKNELIKLLKEQGIKPLCEAPRNTRVEGNVACSLLNSPPYPGTLRTRKAKGKYGKWTGQNVYYVTT